MNKFFTYIILSLLFQNFPAFSENKKKSMNSFKFHFNVEKYQLPNGLTVLLHVDKQVPLVHYQTWFRVGAKDDPPRQTGMAHLFEHMMFRGTKKREGSQFTKDIKSKGISFNAYTNFDHTVYHFDLPKKELAFIAELEAERMAQLNINQKNLNLEKAIVKEERLQRIENNPQSKIIDLFETVFLKSHYRWPVIGYKKDIDRMTTENCQKFYNTFYSPNNAILVISGPIHINKTKKIIKKYYASLKPSKLPKRSYPVEPVQKKSRTKNVFKELQTASLIVGYVSPGIGSKDTYALDILSFILGGGLSSRLHQILVEKQSQSISVQSITYTLQNAGIFLITSDLHPKTPIKAVIQTIAKEIKKTTQNKISEEELSRAKTNIIKFHIDSLKTAQGKASFIGYFEAMLQDYSYLFKELDKYNKVTADDIMLVANKYLKPHQQSLISFLPKK